MSPQKRRTCCGRRAATAAALLLSASQRLSQSLVQIKIAPTTRTSLRAEAPKPPGRESSLTSALGAPELWMPSSPSDSKIANRKEEAFTAQAVLECAKSGDGRRAARWLEVMLSRGLLEEESSSLVFCAVAQALAQQGFGVAASRYLQRCMDMGQTPEAEVFRRVLLELEQGGATDDANDFVLLHEQMRLAGHLPDLDCCKAVLRSLGEANESLDAAVRWVENEMPSCGVEPDDEAFEILFHACRREGRPERARGWLERMRTRAEAEQSPQCIVRVLQEELQSEEVDALELWLSEPKLQELQRCRPLARRLLTRLAETSPQQAEDWLDRLLSAGLEADRMCYSCIAKAWLETGDSSRSAAMVDRMVAAGFLPSREMTAAVLLAGYDDEKQAATEASADARVVDLAQTGRIHEAAQLLLEELAASRAVEASSFDKLIAAFGAKGYPEEATEWFHRMAACGLKQGVQASSALVTAWAVSGNPAKAAEVLKELEDQGKNLDQYAYTSVISAFADAANATASQAPRPLFMKERLHSFCLCLST
ncbi:PGR3 [Symbiodinium sp. CCMP2592]|nr:PGR3 [Symbiodinium sp. CCMP2592]